MPKVSVIVPIYNVEEYLQKCIESIIGQTLTDIEIILVDDGSPDNSGMIADKYAESDSRIKVIHQQNRWLSGARNSGIDVAAGDYLCFVDSDDFIAPEMCSELYDFATQNDCDMVIFDHYCTDSSGIVLSEFSVGKHFGNHHIIDKNDIPSIIYPIIIGTHDINGATFKMYRRSLFDRGFRFDESLRYGEDYASCLAAIPMAERIGYLEKPLYYYVYSPDSIMRSYNKNKIRQLGILYELREKFLSKNGIDSADHERMSANLYLKLVTDGLVDLLSERNTQTPKEKSREIKAVCNDADIVKATSLLKTSDFSTGRFGKMCLVGLKCKSVAIIKLACKLYKG